MYLKINLKNLQNRIKTNYSVNIQRFSFLLDCGVGIIAVFLAWCSVELYCFGAH